MMMLRILARARKKMKLVDLYGEFKSYERSIYELIELNMLWTSVERNIVMVQTNYKLHRVIARTNNFDNLRVWWEGTILRI